MTATGLAVALCVGFLTANFFCFRLVGNMLTSGQHFPDLIHSHWIIGRMIQHVHLIVPVMVGLISHVHDLLGVETPEVGNRIPVGSCLRHISEAQAFR